MSKKHIEAVVRAQFKALGAKDNKERLGYMIAGIKDGKFYTHAHGATFGIFDTEVEDTVFIPESDLELSRITGAKIATVTLNMTKFFDRYYSEDNEEPEKGEASDGDDTTADQPAVDSEPELSEGILEKLAKECKKCIKTEDFKKAKKILVKLEGSEFHKKLAKKLKKAQ